MANLLDPNRQGAGSGGGGNPTPSAPTLSLTIPQVGDVVFRRINGSRNLTGLKANGKAGSCLVSYVTAAQYAAAPDSAAGTPLGTLTVAADGTPSATVAAGQALTDGDYLRFDPANPLGPLHVYESA